MTRTTPNHHICFRLPRDVGVHLERRFGSDNARNTDLPAAGVIERYKALADIERGFRVLKSDIEIAPVHHRLPERIRAHALLRQIQQLQVKIDHRPTTRTSQITAEQRGLLQQLNLPVPEVATPA